MKKFLLLSLLLFAGWTLSFADIPNAILSQNASIAPVLKNVMPAVVNIVTEGELPFPNDPFLQRQMQEALKGKMPRDYHFSGVGSGVIIDAKKGLIVTNAHVVDLAKSILVTLNDGRHYPAKTIGADDATDVAVIQIEADQLHDIPLADSNQLNVGDFVAAVGSPFGLNQTVTSGIVSALHRSDLGIEGLENFIQTDASINMGSSGGALINLKGELVGINTALLSNNSGGNIGIGFAIPSNMVKNVMTQLLKFGKVRRGLIGVLVQTLTPDIAQAFHMPSTKGAVISQIMPYSPALNAGLKVGDVITEMNGETVTSNDDVHNIVGLIREGEVIKLTVSREGKTLVFAIKTDNPETSDNKQREQEPYLYGVSLREVTELSAAHGYVHGIKVMRLKDYSPASLSGLQLGDTIVSANHQPVATIDGLLKLAKPNPSGLLLNVLRGPAAGFVVIK